MEAFDDVWNEDDESIKSGFLEGWHEAMTDAPSRSIWEILEDLDDED